MNYDEQTKHKKWAKRDTPAKSDHEHEYVVYTAWNYLRRFDGTITENKFPRSTKMACNVCGHQPRKSRGKDFVNIEVSVKEFMEISEKV